MNNSFADGTAPSQAKNDSMLQSGPQGGIVGAGLGTRSAAGNPLSQRDKGGREKASMVQKIAPGARPDPITMAVNKSDLSYQ